MCTISFHPHNTLEVDDTIIIPVVRWGNWGTWRSNYLFQVMLCYGMQFECLIHSEARQPKMLGVWNRERCLWQGQARRAGGLCPRYSKFPEDFSKAFLKARWEGGRRVCAWFTRRSLICSWRGTRAMSQGLLTLSVFRCLQVWELMLITS